MGKAKPKIFYWITEDWYFCSHRLDLAIAAKKSGFDVTVITRVRKQGDKIKSAGLKLIPLELSRRGVNPFKEFLVIVRLILILRNGKPDIIHNVALKPVLYGTIAAYFAKVPIVINALAGLGFFYTSTSMLAKNLQPGISFFFKYLLNLKPGKVILQNQDDVDLLCCGQILKKDSISLVPGSGVDIKRFVYHPELGGKPLVVLASRMLWDKGIGEFVSAAKQNEKRARFILVGSSDRENPSAISETQLQDWHNDGVIEWWGHRDDMVEVFAKANIVCLPSYREGMPKVLMEAAACGRAIVTTDTPGCRETICDGKSGFLVPVKNDRALFLAIDKLIKNKELRKEFGWNGRNLAEKHFAVEFIIEQTLAIYQEILS